MEKAIYALHSPLIVIGIAFCVAGMGMFGYLYYSDNVSQPQAKDGNISTKLVSTNDITVYQISNKEPTNNPTNFPSKIQIINDYAGMNGILSYDDIFRVLWIPLIIIGSYILVHAGNGIVTKVRV